MSDGSPLLLLSGEVATGIEGLGMFQDASSQTIDDVSLMKPVTRYSSSVDNPMNLAHLLRHAFLHLLSQPTGPVHLSVPKDSQVADIAAVHTATAASITRPEMLSLPAAEASLGRFLHGPSGGPPTRVVILAGAGAEHAAAAPSLREFAECWGIPVATTLRAKGIFPEDHALSLGTFGYAGTHHARAALLDAAPDLRVVLGSGLNERDTMQWSLDMAPAPSVVVNLSAMAIGNHTTEGGVMGDVGAYLRWLLSQRERLTPALGSTRAARAAWLDGIRAQPRLQDPQNQTSASVPIHPARAVAELRKAFPRDGILLVDSGAHRAFAAQYWDAYEPRTYISATNLGPMGWAIPAAVGVQCARPGSKVAVITGDGCMHMHGIEIATAARYRLPIIVVVINNAALGNVWLRAHSLGPVPDELTSLPDIDWAGFARGLGCNGATVRDPADLAGAFARALGAEGPSVIDVKAGKDYPTPVGDWSAACAAWSYHE
jgi:acetolactate synthase-1/2/3 large subunit